MKCTAAWLLRCYTTAGGDGWRRGRRPVLGQVGRRRSWNDSPFTATAAAFLVGVAVGGDDSLGFVGIFDEVPPTATGNTAGPAAGDNPPAESAAADDDWRWLPVSR